LIANFFFADLLIMSFKSVDKDYSCTLPNGKKTVSYASMVLKGIQEISKLSFLYFSQSNIDNLQIQIKKKIFEESDGKYLIDDQDQKELLIIMRSVYLEYSINNNHDFIKQINCLNQRVLNFVVPQVLSGVELYEQYLKDSKNPLQVMERPSFESMAGTKTYDLSRFL
jgi:hypothetical protein